MKKTLRLIWAALVFAFLTVGGTGVQTAQAATASASAKATILAPVVMTKISDLSFGKIAAGQTASTISIGTNSQVICGIGLTCLGSQTAARFNISGTPGEAVTISLDPTVTLTDGGSNSMTAQLKASATAMFLTAAPKALVVGGVLNVGANQPSGNYSGTFNVTVDYQ